MPLKMALLRRIPPGRKDAKNNLSQSTQRSQRIIFTFLLRSKEKENY
jgi:hypothetical protein